MMKIIPMVGTCFNKSIRKASISERSKLMKVGHTMGKFIYGKKVARILDFVNFFVFMYLTINKTLEKKSLTPVHSA